MKFVNIVGVIVEANSHDEAKEVFDRAINAASHHTPATRAAWPRRSPRAAALGSQRRRCDSAGPALLSIPVRVSPSRYIGQLLGKSA
jgi:hypothetical protein